jgi:cell division control protein 12
VKLRQLLVRTHLYDLIQSTREHYETYRLAHFQAMGKSDDAVIGNTRTMQKMKQDEEQLRKKFTEQVRLEESRFRKWEQNVFFCLIVVDSRA